MRLRVRVSELAARALFPAATTRPYFPERQCGAARAAGPRSRLFRVSLPAAHSFTVRDSAGDAAPGAAGRRWRFCGSAIAAAGLALPELRVDGVRVGAPAGAGARHHRVPGFTRGRIVARTGHLYHR